MSSFEDSDSAVQIARRGLIQRLGASTAKSLDTCLSFILKDGGSYLVLKV